MEDALYEDEEEWRSVPSKPGLRASSWGRLWLPERRVVTVTGKVKIWRTKPRLGCIKLSRKTNSHQYRGINTAEWGNIKVHQAVCESFHGPKPHPEALVLHLNEDGLCNRWDNLRWGTHEENMQFPGYLERCRARYNEDHPFWKRRNGKL